MKPRRRSVALLLLYILFAGWVWTVNVWKIGSEEFGVVDFCLDGLILTIVEECISRIGMIFS